MSASVRLDPGEHGVGPSFSLLPPPDYSPIIHGKAQTFLTLFAVFDVYDFLGVLCDQTLFGDVQTPQGACGEDPAAGGPGKESFDGSSGILAGLAGGYRLSSFNRRLPVP